MTDARRIRILKNTPGNPGAVVYWMSRDQRVHDNWAQLFAQEKALQRNSRLIVLFCMVPSFLNASGHHYDFMLKGLSEVQKELRKYNIPFNLITGEPGTVIPEFLRRENAGLLVTDFDPLRIKRDWKRKISEKISVPFYEVDAHNIIPCFYVSQKQEFAAYTIRPKINRLLHEFLVDFPALKKMDKENLGYAEEISFITMLTSKSHEGVKPVGWIKPGEDCALNALNSFIENKLARYNTERNFPSRRGQSDLSPYIHFGQLSAQRIALNVNYSSVHPDMSASFLEELIVRRELSDNFCLYNENYDNFEGFPDWAKKTLNEHRKDKREYIYSLEELENAQTHDPLWNESQTEMTTRGKMHGYLRMYWAKKILEWTRSPEEAMEYAIYLNDKYELDGRDPNGYAGIAWSIGGVHDRAWGERPVFGKIRYMSYTSTSRKIRDKS